MITIFKKRYGTGPRLLFSPGRINLIGEHTDYNEGLVMPGAINKGIYMAFEKNDLQRVRMYSYDFDEEASAAISQIEPMSANWANYILGVLVELKKTNPKIQGFDVVFGGDIPIGSGLSSSAALECGIGFVLNVLFDLGLKKIDIAKVGQMAEHNFVGVRCGIMDQFASIKGKKNHVIRLDCRSLSYSYFPLFFLEYQILLCNSKVKHSLAESSYNERRSSCEIGVAALQKKYPKVNSLRDATLTMMDAIKASITDTIFKRCSYVIEENQRVQKATQLLKQRNLASFGALLFESHRGLSEKYEVSCKELDFLVNQVKEDPDVLGSRMMGGGFGGCTINLIKRTAKPRLIDQLSTKYKEQYQIELECYEVELVNGTHLLKP
ncbi:galactokinase [Sungkyunkwania multivorans]|uniref:Galactokinase n=1 Tax=Sungkyunkwania multivorans TaxID=1173618 RepID=A0ABW3CX33_9FLAO